MRRLVFFLSTIFVATLVLHSGCRKDEPVYDLAASGYPQEPGKIILSKCATSGCHTDESKEASAGLSLSSWDKMFEGDHGGAVVIPYSPEYSTLCMFSNVYPDLGITVEPSMPIGGTPLTRDEVMTLKNWIANGAPNAKGEVKFADDPRRKKYYVTNQGCDVVTVFDAATRLQMRYIKVGNSAAIEAPHNVKITADGNYWCIVSLGGNSLQKYRTADDSYVGEAIIGGGNWNTLTISPDSHYAFAVDFSTQGKVAVVDLTTMSFITYYQGSGILNQIHGSTISADGHTLWLTCQSGNYVNKLDLDQSDLHIPPAFNKVILDGTSVPVETGGLRIHELAYTPDYSKYFVTCEGTGEVRVVQASNDSLLGVIPVGTDPVEMSFSQTHPYLFVTCMDDTTSFPGQRGSVAVINYNTNTFVTSLHPGHQPHGLTVDDDHNVVVVANRNVTNAGPAPHHTSVCGGRNGYVTYIDMNTLQLVPGAKTEISVDPYSVGYRR